MLDNFEFNDEIDGVNDEPVVKKNDPKEKRENMFNSINFKTINSNHPFPKTSNLAKYNVQSYISNYEIKKIIKEEEERISKEQMQNFYLKKTTTAIKVSDQEIEAMSQDYESIVKEYDIHDELLYTVAQFYLIYLKGQKIKQESAQTKYFGFSRAPLDDLLQHFHRDQGEKFINKENTKVLQIGGNLGELTYKLQELFECNILAQEADKFKVNLATKITRYFNKTTQCSFLKGEFNLKNFHKFGVHKNQDVIFCINQFAPSKGFEQIKSCFKNISKLSEETINEESIIVIENQFKNPEFKKQNPEVVCMRHDFWEVRFFINFIKNTYNLKVISQDVTDKQVESINDTLEFLRNQKHVFEMLSQINKFLEWKDQDFIHSYYDQLIEMCLGELDCIQQKHHLYYRLFIVTKNRTAVQKHLNKNIQNNMTFFNAKKNYELPGTVVNGEWNQNQATKPGKIYDLFKERSTKSFINQYEYINYINQYKRQRKQDTKHTD